MTRRALEELAALLARAASAPDVDDDTRADYAAARDVVAELDAGLDELSEPERERLALNGDLPQLAFHLAEELRDGTPETIPGSLRFLRRHVTRILAEYRDHERPGPLDAQLLLGLARLTRATYEERFAAAYAAAGYRRRFVDKLYRDYALTGVPDGLLLELDRLANADDHDVVLCVLKGALPYVLLMELCGLPSERVRWVMAGRSTGSHIAPEYVVAPVGFELDELAGRRVLVVENNAATGATLERLAEALAAAPPARATLVLDYVLQPLPALARHFDDVVCGPFEADDVDRARALKQLLATRLRRHTG